MDTLPLSVSETVTSVLLLATGLVIGSFLNVVIARVPEGQSIVWPGSRCGVCGTPIRWFDNIPLISWLSLRGRCRACKAPVSIRYPLVEGLTAALFVAAFRRFGVGWELYLALGMVVFLIPLVWIDLEQWLLPFELTLPGTGAGLLLSVPLGAERVRDGVLGAAIGFFLFWLLEKLGRAVFRKEALGAGDKYLLMLLGAFLSYRPLLGIVLLSSFQGAIVGLALLAVRGRAGPAPKEPDEPAQSSVQTMTASDDWVPGPTNMPFGPWLALAGLEVLLLEPLLLRWLPRNFGALLLGRI